MNILVTGGLGYIGSHTCVELLKKNYNVVILDNLYNSSVETINYIEKITNKSVTFKKIDVTDGDAVNEVFKKYDIDGVIHFAGVKSVSESITNPIKYYYNNVVSTLILAKACKKYNVENFVFSSSATVYGDNKSPLTENMELLPTTNPYGESKAMSEKILYDLSVSDKKLSTTILRYFNPIGAHKSGLIGEKPNPSPNNLMPYITQVASKKKEKLFIFGKDYPTIDGTGVRDYIHVVDLAKGHVAALESDNFGFNIYNLGTGKGTSVLELIKSFEKTNNVKVPYEFSDRRLGDIATCYADITKAKKELNWEAKEDLNAMCRDTWRFEKNRKI